MTTFPDLTAYDDTDLATLSVMVTTERDNRLTIAGADQNINQILTNVQLAQGHTAGDEWVQPQGAHDAYPLGFQVTHNAKLWESLTTANVWEPGVSSWREIVDPGQVAAWVQPGGSTDAYPIGAKVTYGGSTWQNNTASNVWVPGVYGWDKVSTP